MKAKRSKHQTGVQPVASPPGRVASGSGFAVVTYVETGGSPLRLPVGFRPTKQKGSNPGQEPETHSS